jgi:hypothetical protein
MPNEIDLVVGEVAFQKITDLINRLKDVDEEFGKIATKFSNLGKTGNPQSTAELAKLTAENQKLNKSLIELRASYTTIDTELDKVNKKTAASSKLITQETIDIRLKNKELTQEYTELSKVSDAYQVADSQFKQMSKSLKAMAFEGKEGTKAFIDKEKALLALGNRLKAVDAMTGSHTRNVGNYASSWNGLGNSINQLTREAPAFANSLQTGFMALSNNIPILTDELGILIDKNKKLQEQGKPTESILKTVAGAFFSWQTAISLGVTILTVYGAKLIDMMFNTDGVKRATDSLTNSLKLQQTQLDKNIKVLEYNAEIEIELAKKRGASEKEILEIKKKLGVDTVSETEKQYNILNARTDSFDKYRALQAQGGNKALLFLLDKYNGDIEKARKEYQRREVVYTDANRKLLVDSKTKLYDQLKEKNDKNVLDELRGQNELNKKAEQLANKPVAQERKLLTFDEVKSQHDLDEAILATDKIREKSVDMSEWTTEQKIANLDLLSLTEIKTASEIANKEIDIANKKMADNKTANDLALKNNKKFATQHAKNILDIEKTNKNEILTANEVLNGKILESALNTDKAIKVLSDEDLKSTQQLAIAKLNTEIIAEKLIIDNKVKGANKTKLQQEEAFKEYVKLSLAKIDLEEKVQLAAEPNPIKQEIIKQNFADLRKGIENILSPIEEVKKSFADLSTSGQIYNKNLSESLDKLGMSSLKTFLDFDEFGQSSFQKMWENADTTQKKTTVMFQAIGDAAQQYFGMISEVSEANFQEDLRRLDAQKEISLSFAGDSAVAKEKIEEDYAKKKKELELKQFKDKQKMAVANIAIDTAQAIMQIWAHSPDFSGISQSTMSVIIGALGAVQMGMVLAQKPPAYAEGTDNHSGGMMLVNDGKGSNFQEKVILPSGKVIRPQGRNVLMDAPKGTKVLNHEQQLFEMLQSNNISMSSPQYQGMTPDEMDEILGKHFGNIKTQNTIFDKNGFQSYVRNGNSITRSNSNRSQAIGISV